MNWQDIEVSLNRKNFTYKGKTLFKEDFTEVLEFQDPGIAAVKNQNGWFHIMMNGQPISFNFYERAFGFYYNRAAVIENNLAYHIGIDGLAAYDLHDKWFRLLDVYHKGYARAKDEKGWFHVDRNGDEIYQKRYSLIEPFYNGFAFCVTLNNKQIILNEFGEEFPITK